MIDVEILAEASGDGGHHAFPVHRRPPVISYTRVSHGRKSLSGSQLEPERLAVERQETNGADLQHQFSGLYGSVWRSFLEREALDDILWIQYAIVKRN